MALRQSYSDFVSRQGKILGGIQETHDDIRNGKTGLKADPAITERVAGYLVAWRFNENVTGRIGSIAAQVGLITPTAEYGPDNAHSTLGDHGVEKNRSIDPASEIHRDTVGALAEAVEETLQSLGRSDRAGLKFSLGRFVTNTTTVIATGTPSPIVWDVGGQVELRSAIGGLPGADDGKGLRPAWGGHITGGRYLQDALPVVGQGVAALLDSVPPLGEVVPSAIDVGYFGGSPEAGFKFTRTTQFDLGRLPTG